MQNSTDNLDFRDLFTEVDSKFQRLVTLQELKDSPYNVSLLSAISKCLDFNLFVQKSQYPSFFMLANLRAIIEELVYFAVFKNIGDPNASNIINELTKLTSLKNIEVQKTFFAGNNKQQPIYGDLFFSEKLEEGICNAKNSLKVAWEQQGFTVRPGHNPSIHDLTERVELQTTYKYCYYLTSNFVHFNVNQLYRLGWGAHEGTFSFKIQHFESYFSSLSKFLGALVFLGYCHLAPYKFESGSSSLYAETIDLKLKGKFRWPEITTYEEMNAELPNILTQAFQSCFRSDDNPSPMSDVLSELQGLSA